MITGDSYDNGPKITVGSLERCRPDYEAMIARLAGQRDKELKFKDALLEYLKGRTVEGKMAEIVGEIVTRCNGLQCELDGLIKRQEEDKE